MGLNKDLLFPSFPRGKINTKVPVKVNKENQLKKENNSY